MHSTISEYIMKARQDDAARAGERDRRLVEARRVRILRRSREELPGKYTVPLRALRAITDRVVGGLQA